MLRKNDIYEAEIIDYTAEGSGICKIDGFAVFVPSVAVGDKLRVRILKVAKSYAFGKAEEIVEASPSRISSDCPVFGKCGGCTFRHIRYDAELAFKQKRVTDALSRIGCVAPGLIEPIVGADMPSCYRNKVQMPVTKDSSGIIKAGFFAPRSHRIIPLDDCMLQCKAFAPAMEIIFAWANTYGIVPYDEATHTGVLRHIYLRYGEKTHELMVCIVSKVRQLRHEKQLVEALVSGLPELKTVVLNINPDKTNVIVGKECHNLYGEGYITDELCGKRFRISPLSFYQVNRTQAERLYKIASDFAALKRNETLLDMYCGTGTIGLTMADQVKSLIGVEIIPQAIEDARKNALMNGITNAEFICGDAAEAISALNKRGILPDCVIVDPPRKGCDGVLIDTVALMDPTRVVYVSCDPATLARDVKLFSAKGYSVQRAVPVDLFPRTCHVETVVLMSRPLTEHEKYGEYFMNRSVSDIMSEYSEQHDEWH